MAGKENPIPAKIVYVRNKANRKDWLAFICTEYKQARFSSYTKGVQELCDWLGKYNCTDICMESTGKYWIPVFNILEKNNIWITLSYPKHTKPQKGTKTNRKDANWICELYMRGMVKSSFIPPTDIRELANCSSSLLMKWQTLLSVDHLAS